MQTSHSLAELKEEWRKRQESQRRIALGLLPSVRGVWDKEAGLAHARRLVAVLSGRPYGVRLVNLRGLYGEGVVTEGSPTKPAVQHFQQQGIDLLLAANCTYSEENVTAAVARRVCLADPVPVPVFTYMGWDEDVQPDGKRLTERLCGGWPMRDMLRQAGLRAAGYIPASRPGDDVFHDGLKNALGVAGALKVLRGMHVLQIGPDCPTFGGIKANERQIYERFGIQVEGATLSALTDRMMELLADPPTWLADEVNQLEGRLDLTKAREQDAQAAEKMCLMLFAVLELLDKYNCNAVTIRCWTELLEKTGAMACFTMGELNSLGIPASCETDKNGLLSMGLLMGASLEKPPMFADFTTVIEHDGKPIVLWWHCGPFPICLCRKGFTPELRPGYILPVKGVGLASCPIGELGETLTSARLCHQGDEFVLVTLEGKVVDGPDNWGTHLWTSYEDWPMVEYRLNQLPVEHHWACILEEQAHILMMVAPWLGARFEVIEPPEKELIESIICRSARE